MSQSQALQELYTRYKEDASFDTLRHSIIRFVEGTGPFSPDVMLLGEAPGRMENAWKKPFQGSAGLHLTNLLEDVEIDASKIFLTNAVKYWPRELVNGRWDTRSPSEEEIDATRDYIIEEVDIVNPRFVGLCGLTAIRVFFPQITKVYPHNGNLMDEKFVPLFHPAVIGYNKEKKREVRDGYRRLANYIKELKAA